MTVSVDDRTLWRAFALGRSEDLERWQRVAAWAAERPGDPTPGRAAELRELLGVDGADDELFERAADQLAAGAGGPLLTRALDWFDDDLEAAAPLLEVFTGHHAGPDDEPVGPDPALVAALEAWWGAPIERAVLISGGFSRRMLDVTWTGGEPRRAVVRIEQAGMFATDGAREVAVMRRLRAAGYPVPAVLREESDPGVLGEPFFVMEWIDGAPRLDEHGVDESLRTLVALHALDPAVVRDVQGIDGVAPDAAPAAVIEAQLEHWHRVYRAAVRTPIPLLEKAFAWLRANLHPTGPSVVVHGDPGPGNALHAGERVAAVIDWEFAHAGDPAEDWAYLAFIRGRKIMSPGEWKRRLARTAGVEFDDDTWLAWEVFNGVKGACVNLTALDVFARSPHPTPDQLAIGIAIHLRFLARVVEVTARAGA